MSLKVFQTEAAKRPPTIGPTQNTQWSVHLFATTAAPKERAGLTEVPSIGIPAIWITQTESPMKRGASPAEKPSSHAVANTVKTYNKPVLK